MKRSPVAAKQSFQRSYFPFLNEVWQIIELVKTEPINQLENKSALKSRVTSIFQIYPYLDFKNNLLQIEIDLETNETYL